MATRPGPVSRAHRLRWAQRVGLATGQVPPGVLDQQVHRHRRVLEQQGGGLDEDLLAGPELADEDVAGPVEQQQAGLVTGGEPVEVLPHRVMTDLLDSVPEPAGDPGVIHLGGGDQEDVLADVDRLPRRQRQRDDVARLVPRERQPARALGLDHHQRQPGQLPPPRPAGQRHAGEADLRVLPQQQVVREVDPVAGGQLEIGHGDVRPLDLAERLAELELGHVADGRQLRPAGPGDGGPDVQRRPARGAAGLAHVRRRVAAPRAGILVRVGHDVTRPCGGGTSTGCPAGRARSSSPGTGRCRRTGRWSVAAARRSW